MDKEGCKSEGYSCDSMGWPSQVLNRREALVQNVFYLFGGWDGGVKKKLQLGSYGLLLSSGKEMGNWWCLVKMYYFVVTLHKLLLLPHSSVQARKGLGSPCESHQCFFHQAALNITSPLSFKLFLHSNQIASCSSSIESVLDAGLRCSDGVNFHHWWFLLKGTSSKTCICHFFVTHVAQKWSLLWCISRQGSLVSGTVCPLALVNPITGNIDEIRSHVVLTESKFQEEEN